MRVWPGNPLPLGATFDGVGTNVAIFSEVADAVAFCVFDDDGNETCVELPDQRRGNPLSQPAMTAASGPGSFIHEKCVAARDAKSAGASVRVVHCVRPSRDRNAASEAAGT